MNKSFIQRSGPLSLFDIDLLTKRTTNYTSLSDDNINVILLKSSKYFNSGLHSLFAVAPIKRIARYT